MQDVESEPDLISIPSIYDMDDETFLKHMHKRHQHDFKNYFPIDSVRGYQKFIPLYRSFHETIHRLKVDGYDHIHKPRKKKSNGV